MVPPPPLAVEPSPSESTSRREQRRQYKETPRAMGVYLMCNTVTQHRVLKSSLNLDGAINRERFELRMGSHRDLALQHAWRQLGEAALQIEVIEVVKHRPDPGFDPAAALAESLALWRAELLPAQVSR